MICAPPWTPCSQAAACRKSRPPASAATSNGNPAMSRIIFEELFRHQRQVHGLQADPSRSRETIPENLARAGKQTLRKALKNRLHRDRAVLVNPAAGFNVNLLPGFEFHFKNIAVTVKP